MMYGRSRHFATVLLPVLIFGAARWAGAVHRTAAPEAALPADSAGPARLEFSRSGIGRSGALFTRQVMPGQKVAAPVDWKGAAPLDASYRWINHEQTGPSLPFEPLLRAPAESGVYSLEITQAGTASLVEDFTLLVKVPRTEVRGGRLKGYRMGEYPESAATRTGRYALPDGFIQVDKNDVDLRLSEHFTVGEFLTHDQNDVWPKFVVVEPRLLDKLELVMADLERRGIPAKHMVIMSGFRTPQYNERGVGRGRAVLSRHQYGDAADVWIDNDRNWYMDDLNNDGRRDTGDARIILESVERVEAAHPELIGGAGIYRDNGAHGPFIHIDTRGSRARW